MINPLKMSALHWFAIRVTYSRELAFKSFLDEAHIENFIPMRYVYAERNGQRMRRLVPAVHNLVFVRASREQMDEFKNMPGMNIPIRYIMNRETHQPIVVPDEQMHSFMLVAGTNDDNLLYLDSEELNLVKGSKVRITGGIFEGAIGEFVRIRHDRRLVINIAGIMAVATTFIHPSLVEVIEE